MEFAIGANLHNIFNDRYWFRDFKRVIWCFDGLLVGSGIRNRGNRIVVGLGLGWVGDWLGLGVCSNILKDWVENDYQPRKTVPL